MIEDEENHSVVSYDVSSFSKLLSSNLTSMGVEPKYQVVIRRILNSVNRFAMENFVNLQD